MPQGKENVSEMTAARKRELYELLAGHIRSVNPAFEAIRDSEECVRAAADRGYLLTWSGERVRPSEGPLPREPLDALLSGDGFRVSNDEGFHRSFACDGKSVTNGPTIPKEMPKKPFWGNLLSKIGIETRAMREYREAARRFAMGDSVRENIRRVRDENPALQKTDYTDKRWVSKNVEMQDRQLADLRDYANKNRLASWAEPREEAAEPAPEPEAKDVTDPIFARVEELCGIETEKDLLLPAEEGARFDWEPEAGELPDFGGVEAIEGDGKGFDAEDLPAETKPAGDEREKAVATVIFKNTVRSVAVLQAKRGAYTARLGDVLENLLSGENLATGVELVRNQPGFKQFAEDLTPEQLSELCDTSKCGGRLCRGFREPVLEGVGLGALNMGLKAAEKLSAPEASAERSYMSMLSEL